MKNRKLHFLQCRHNGCGALATSPAVSRCGCGRNPFKCDEDCGCRKVFKKHSTEIAILNAQGEKGVSRILNTETEEVDKIEEKKKYLAFKKTMGWS